jgi:hypothetical protein
MIPAQIQEIKKTFDGVYYEQFIIILETTSPDVNKLKKGDILDLNMLIENRKERVVCESSF